MSASLSGIDAAAQRGGVFFALMSSAQAIRDANPSAVDKLMPLPGTTRRQARMPR